MKPYDITIRAAIVQTSRIFADSEAEAIETAHDLFEIDATLIQSYDLETVEVSTTELITGE